MIAKAALYVTAAGLSALAAFTPWSSSLKPSPDEQLYRRVAGYYQALEQRELAKAWGFLGERMRDDNESDHKYADMLASFYTKVKRVTKPELASSAKRIEAEGDAPATVHTRLQISTPNAKDINVIHITEWVREPTQTGREWFLLSEEMRPLGGKISTVVSRR